MSITIVISWKTVLRQTGWSVGYCQYCDRYEAIQVGDWVQVTSLYDIVPVTSQVVGEGFCCDTCEQEAIPPSKARIIAIEDWSPREGIHDLFELCAPSLRKKVPSDLSEDDIRSILASVARRTSVNSIDIGLGLIGGIVLGAALGLLISFGLSLMPELGRNPVVMMPFAGGILIGSVVGSIIEVVVKSRSKARKMVRAAFQKHQVDTEKLAEIARSYPGRIRSAVNFALMQSR